MRTRLPMLSCAAVLSLGGCFSSEIPSELGQVRVGLSGLESTGHRSHRATMPILVGSVSSLRYNVQTGDFDCFAISVSGATVGSDTIRFDQLGPVVFTFEPVPCEADEAVQPDRLELAVISPDAVSGRFVLPAIEYGLRLVDEGSLEVVEPRVLPSDLVPASGAELVLVAGVGLPLNVALFDGEEPVLVGAGAGTLTATGGAALTLDHPLSGEVFVPEPGRGEVRFLTPTGVVEIGSYVAVEPRDVRRLEAGVIMGNADDSMSIREAGVAAWGVTGSGQRIHGLPVEVQVVKGPMFLPPVGEIGPWKLTPEDCTGLHDLAGTVARRRVRFKYGGRRVTLDLDFDYTDVVLTPEERQASIDEFEPMEECVDSGSNAGGCGCSASSTPAGGLGLLLLAGLGLLRRRR